MTPLLLMRGGVAKTAYSAEVLADSPTLYYRLDETSGNFVDSANGHNATPSGTIVTATGLIAGDSDAAAKFDWAGTLKQADTSFAIGGTPLTVECWVNFASHTLDPAASGYFASVNANLLLGSSGAAGSDGWTVGVDINGKAYMAHHGVGDVTWGTFNLLSNTTWHLVWVMIPTTQTDLYVNGSFVASQTMAAMIAPTGGFVINNGSPGVNSNPRCATNALDEVAVYSSALSAGRILAHYNAGI